MPPQESPTPKKETKNQELGNYFPARGSSVSLEIPPRRSLGRVGADLSSSLQSSIERQTGKESLSLNRARLVEGRGRKRNKECCAPRADRGPREEPPRHPRQHRGIRHHHLRPPLMTLWPRRSTCPLSAAIARTSCGALPRASAVGAAPALCTSNVEPKRPTTASSCLVPLCPALDRFAPSSSSSPPNHFFSCIRSPCRRKISFCLV